MFEIRYISTKHLKIENSFIGILKKRKYYDSYLKLQFIIYNIIGLECLDNLEQF